MGLKDRIRQYAEFKGLNPKSFETIVGLSNGAFSKLSDNTRRSTIDRISIAFPDLNQNWLLTGEGEMLKVPSSAPAPAVEEGVHTGTPVYDIDGTCGTENRDIDFTDEHVIGYVDLPGVNKEACIIRANGDSMEPRIYDGNLVVIREIYNWEDVFYGQIYLVLLDEYRMIKYIRRYEPDEENYIILRSENTKYDDIKLHKKKIRKLFIVENILSVRAQL